MDSHACIGRCWDARSAGGVDGCLCKVVRRLVAWYLCDSLAEYDLNPAGYEGGFIPGIRPCLGAVLVFQSLAPPALLPMISYIPVTFNHLTCKSLQWKLLPRRHFARPKFHPLVLLQM